MPEPVEKMNKTIFFDIKSAIAAIRQSSNEFDFFFGNIGDKLVDFEESTPNQKALLALRDLIETYHAEQKSFFHYTTTLSFKFLKRDLPSIGFNKDFPQLLPPNNHKIEQALDLIQTGRYDIEINKLYQGYPEIYKFQQLLQKWCDTHLVSLSPASSIKKLLTTSPTDELCAEIKSMQNQLSKMQHELQLLAENLVKLKINDPLKQFKKTQEK